MPIAHKCLARIFFLLICSLMVLLCSGCNDSKVSEYEGTFLSNHEASEFSVLDHKGRVVSNLEHNGDAALLTFLFTKCTDVCPIVTSSIKKALNLLENPSDVVVVIVTVDPSGDTPTAVKNYISKWDLGDNWSYITGPEELVKPIWMSYFVSPQIAQSTKNSLANSFDRKYNVTHTSPVYILDRLGKARVVHTSPIDPNAVAVDLKKIMNKRTQTFK